MPNLRPSTYLILGLLALLAWHLHHLLIAVAPAVALWTCTQPAALLLLLLGAIGWRATHPTTQIRTR